MPRSLTALLTAATLAGLFLASSASAAAHCGDREAAIEILGEQYKEKLVGHGISMSGDLVELFVSEQTLVVGNTWTIAITSPYTQILCLVSAGAVWFNVVSVDAAQ
jgi:hypothetical protein